MRQRIRAVLEHAPGWRTRHDIEAAVPSDHPLGDTLQKMAQKGLIVSDKHGHYRQAEDRAARAAEAMAEAILAEAAKYVYPRGDLELRILETLRAYSPMPITPVQMAVMVGQPREVVLAHMQALATLGTVARPTRSYYQHIPLPSAGLENPSTT